MLNLYFGNDTIKVRKKALDDASSFGVGIEVIDADNYEAGIFTEATNGVSLFGGTRVFVVDMPSQNKELYTDVVSNLAEMQESPYTFVIIEGTLLATEKKKFDQYVSKLEEIKSTPETKFNNFALADALASRDKKSLWLLLNEARLIGVRTEELIGILWWQLKTLRLSALTKNASEAGLKDYPYNKAKRALVKFKAGELEKLSASLLSLQHDSRLGLCELDTSLERWVLKL